MHRLGFTAFTANAKGILRGQLAHVRTYSNASCQLVLENTRLQLPEKPDLDVLYPDARRSREAIFLTIYIASRRREQEFQDENCKQCVGFGLEIRRFPGWAVAPTRNNSIPSSAHFLCVFKNVCSTQFSSLNAVVQPSTNQSHVRASVQKPSPRFAKNTTRSQAHHVPENKRILVSPHVLDDLVILAPTVYSCVPTPAYFLAHPRLEKYPALTKLSSAANYPTWVLTRSISASASKLASLACMLANTYPNQPKRSLSIERSIFEPLMVLAQAPSSIDIGTRDDYTHLRLQDSLRTFADLRDFLHGVETLMPTRIAGNVLPNLWVARCVFGPELEASDTAYNIKREWRRASGCCFEIPGSVNFKEADRIYLHNSIQFLWVQPIAAPQPRRQAELHSRTELRDFIKREYAECESERSGVSAGEKGPGVLQHEREAFA
ncbi:hypothetical protein C8R43DRAFT_1109894 [Mycena crocata]|nr:hypothetical protein C8R43DRAFT_1109894 [Mycena crocata]